MSRDALGTGSCLGKGRALHELLPLVREAKDRFRSTDLRKNIRSFLDLCFAE